MALLENCAISQRPPVSGQQVRPALHQLAVGSLRVDIGRHPNDAQASQLVGELAASSEHFRKRWGSAPGGKSIGGNCAAARSRRRELGTEC
ncbi:MmyB family transcriptional regulator [Arthrobacter sp. MMS18-M83]|uniref:MmyB family transcriptional regulator n=1 Tax=Arthrobacter sp. MMS18-M83 TaxID=2996261 RepID=UPI003FA347D6